MMRRSVLFALCWLALLSGLPSYSALAANNNVSQIELTAQKELLQTQIEAIKGLHQKDADAINKRIDDQLAQVGQGVDRFGVIVSVLGTLVSLLLAGLGLLGYVTVSNKTKIEAEKAAQDWFDANEQNLKQRLSDVDKLAADAHQNILAAQHGVDQQAQDVHDAMDRMQTQIGKVPLDQTGGDAFDVSADARVVLERAQQLEKTPESSYSFDDWNTRGHAAYSRNAFDEAAYLWLKASKIPNAGAVNVAQVLFNRGLAQGEVGQSQEEIKTYDEVLHRFGDASELALKEHVARSLVNKGFRQGQLGLNEEAIKISDEVLRRFGDASELALKEQVARALINKGLAQYQLGQSEAAIKTSDEVVRRFGDASELALKEPVARALINKGFAQGQLGQSEEEIKTSDEVLRRFGNASEPALKVGVARALVNKGVSQGQLGQSEEEIKTYDDVLRRFGDASELALKELMAQALLNKGVRQGHLGQSEEEIKTYDEVLRRFSDASELVLKEPLAKALVIKGITQSQLGQSEAAIKSYDEVLCRFGDASEFALKERVAQALVNKGNTQRQLGQSEEAIKTYDEVLRRFGDASEVALKEQVADALNVMGFSFLTQAKAQWADRYAANALLLKARECFTHAITKMPQTWGMALGNRAYAHWLMGNPTDAETDFAAGLRAEKFAGQDLYEGTLKDFETHPIAEDQSMRAMVDRLWVDYQNEKTGAVGHA